MNRELVFEVGTWGEVHAVTLAELSDGGLFCAWFAGTREGNPDVTIWGSVRRNGVWAQPWQIAAHDTYACYNPVALALKGNGLLLFYRAGPNPREWWSYVMTLWDGGRTWTTPTRLVQALGPIKNKPILLDDGILLCPSSLETSSAWTTVMERVELQALLDSPAQAQWMQTPVPTDAAFPADLIQPTVLVHHGALQILLRSKQGVLYQSWSRDEGQSWSAAAPTNMPNPNSGVDAVTLADGRHVLIYNPTRPEPGQWGGPRTPLLAAVSVDGQTWRDFMVLEDQPGRYSYPAVIQGQDGTIHIAYTYDRKSMAVVDIAPAEIQ